MIMSRRAFLATTAAAMAPWQAGATTPKVLTAAESLVRLAPAEHPETALWCFDGLTPGPELRAKQGERLSLDFVNNLSEPSAIHWHGIRIDNAMDGVPGLTQEAVQPGETFRYDFELPDAGTYWYHSHNRSWEQVARGLYGPLIVEEAQPPEVDQDQTLVLDDWRLAEGAEIAGGFGSMRDWSHAGRFGNWVTVNSLPEPSYPTRRHERLRLRLINAANARTFTLSAKGVRGWVVALDGQPLVAPKPFERVVLAPAQRADLIVDVLADGDEAPVLISHERDGDYAMATFPATGDARAAPLPQQETFLMPNPVPTPGKLDDALKVDLVMQGGAMGRMADAEFEGQTLGIRELVRKGKAWAFNSVAGMAEAPLFTAERGRTVEIKLVNDTSWPHGIHVHGHHFAEAGDTSVTLRDTILLNRGETKRIAFTADNPGDWLLHCHMLEHAAAGMTSWFRVT